MVMSYHQPGTGLPPLTHTMTVIGMGHKTVPRVRNLPSKYLADANCSDPLQNGAVELPPARARNMPMIGVANVGGGQQEETD